MPLPWLNLPIKENACPDPRAICTSSSSLFALCSPTYFMLHPPVCFRPCSALRPCLHVPPLALCSHNFILLSLPRCLDCAQDSVISLCFPMTCLAIVTLRFCLCSIRCWGAKPVPSPRLLFLKQFG